MKPAPIQSVSDTRTPVQLHDELGILSDENLGRLAVLERLCDLMAANAYPHTRVDFGEVRAPHVTASNSRKRCSTAI
jgi:hypothetical protein